MTHSRLTGPDESWLDAEATQAVRPYAITGGRTEPVIDVNLLSMLVTAGQPTGRRLNPEHVQILRLCQRPVSVAEVAALLRLPVSVVKILVSDLVEERALHTSPPLSPGETGTPTPQLLERVLRGLERNL